MDNAIVRRRTFKPLRSHHSAAERRSIPRTYIDMPAPEAFWAVIGVSIPRHVRATVPAVEILDGSFEAHGAENTLKPCSLQLADRHVNTRSRVLTPH